MKKMKKEKKKKKKEEEVETTTTTTTTTMTIPPIITSLALASTPTQTFFSHSQLLLRKHIEVELDNVPLIRTCDEDDEEDVTVESRGKTDRCSIKCEHEEKDISLSQMTSEHSFSVCTN
jgi:hypothetical protein